MTLGAVGIGDTGAGGVDCGANPCTWLDSIYAGWGSPQCVPYLACMNPTDPRVIGLVGSAATGLATDIGSATAAGVGAAASGLSANTSFGGFIVIGALLLGYMLLSRR